MLNHILFLYNNNIFQIQLEVSNRITLKDFKLWASQFNVTEEISPGEKILKEFNYWE